MLNANVLNTSALEMNRNAQHSNFAFSLVKICIYLERQCIEHIEMNRNAYMHLIYIVILAFIFNASLHV